MTPGSGCRLNRRNNNPLTNHGVSTMKSIVLIFSLLASSIAAHAQFGSGVVFDPTQSAHAAQQILQSNQLYTTTVETSRNVIGAYNLAQKMSTLPQAYYSSFSNMGRQQWSTLQ